MDPGNFIHFEDYELQFIPPGLLWECSRAITVPPRKFPVAVSIFAFPIFFFVLGLVSKYFHIPFKICVRDRGKEFRKM